MYSSPLSTPYTTCLLSRPLILTYANADDYVVHFNLGSLVFLANGNSNVNP